MENARTYLVSKLSEVVKDISTLKILYKVDPLSREHLIKVLPLVEFSNSKAYQAIEEELLFDFINKFPNDGLVFLSEDEWIDINNPDYIFEGISYFEESKLLKTKDFCDVNFIDNELFSFTKIEDDILNLSEIISSYSEIKIDEILPAINITELFQEYYEQKNTSENCHFNESAENIKICNNNNHIVAYCDCSNFALAA
jgi:hypothetical protein